MPVNAELRIKHIARRETGQLHSFSVLCVVSALYVFFCVVLEKKHLPFMMMVIGSRSTVNNKTER